MSTISAPLLLLVGLPGSGKSTWAAQFIRDNPGYRIVSTDAIRAELYGDAAIQGEWRQVWTEVQQRWQEGLQDIITGQLAGLIYDATNACRRQRRSVIATARALGYGPIVVYWFDVPLSVCLQRNHLRQRQVPEEVINRMHRQLQGAPPSITEAVDHMQRLTPPQLMNLDLPSSP